MQKIDLTQFWVKKLMSQEKQKNCVSWRKIVSIGQPSYSRSCPENPFYFDIRQSHPILVLWKKLYIEKNGVFVVWGRNRTHDGQIRRNILKLSLSSFLFAAMIQCCTTTTTYVCARVRVPFNLSKQRKKTWFRFNKRFSHMTSQFSRMTSRFSLVWRHGSPAWRHGSAGAKKVSIQTRWRK
jgi:hypothetical protein